MSDLFRPEAVENRANRLYGEIVITQPPSTRYLVAALVFICILAASWLVIGSYARIETAPGILVTDTPSPRIVAPQAGILTALNVAEGTTVKAGDTLAVISIDRQSEGGRGAASTGMAAVDARIGLGAEQVRLGMQRSESERARLASVIATAEAQATSLDGQVALQRDIVASNKALYEQMAPVLERGFVSKIEFERRRQTWLASQQTLATLTQQREAQRAQGVQAQAQLAQIGSEGAQQANEIKSSLQALAQQKAELEGQKSYILRAPVAGRVTALQTNLGSTALPGTVLMTIVPLHAAMKAEIYAPSRAIGFVQPGEETRLLYDAFPYQRFGSFKGVVASVSRIVIDPREANIPVKLEEPVYKVTVVLDRQSVEAFGQTLPLQPGMALTANIVLERQSFLDWLLTPLRAVRNRS
ncbi:HlyD family secretion protein [Sphingomonas sp. SUN039]|uniref:HlyD family secretion protein n=1 Tax=Sphingomonas sp. SUN039 TaxID=2937787 RepID=UPI00216464EB|nr:HlyD family efflux transporter periplasmic adaptor subunit [Sphingomonas sp. SUN039]UVO54511.1 HlyD family efflux transporter periplasmic adaptor subunit [Sphingomonas sp. SUN039]